MEGGGSEEKKLLCCFVVANEKYYHFYALDFYDDQKDEVGDDVEINYELGVYVGEYLPFYSDLPCLPDPFLTIPKNGYGVENGFSYWMGFGLLNGMLYMVSSTRKVYVFDTHDITSRRSPLNYSECVSIGPELNAPKPDPVVIPLAGKLFVFCRSLYPDRKYSEDVIEVLDPEKKCWSIIQLPPTLVDYAKKNPCNKIEDLFPNGCRVWNPYLIESHATVGNSIVFYLNLCRIDNILFKMLVLDAETLSWKSHILLDLEQITCLPYRKGCLFWNGIWCSENAFSGGVVMKLQQQGMEEEDDLEVPLPSEQVTDGKVVRVDDNTLLVFSYDMISQHHFEPCPDYFRLDMLRAHKRKRNNDGVDKLTANVVKSLEFSFKRYNPRFQLAYCYCLSY